MTPETCTREVIEDYKLLMQYLQAFVSCSIYGYGTETIYGPATGDGDTRVEYKGMIHLLKPLCHPAGITLDAGVALRKNKKTKMEH